MSDFYGAHQQAFAQQTQLSQHAYDMNEVRQANWKNSKTYPPSRAFAAAHVPRVLPVARAAPSAQHRAGGPSAAPVAVRPRFHPTSRPSLQVPARLYTRSAY